MATIIDLFCGAGGLSSGMAAAGAEVLAGFDCDKDSLYTFKKNHSGARAVFADLSQQTPELLHYKGADLVIGGPPCQGFSISGKRNPKDERNQLYKIYIETLSKLKPKMFLLENVPNMISMDGGRFKDSVLNELGSLGYKIGVQIITASNYGVPQKRRRVFFFGSFDKKFELKPDIKDEVVNCRQALSDLPNYSLDNGQPYPNKSQSNYQKAIRLGSKGIWNHILTKHSEQTAKIIALVPDGGNYKHLPPEYINTRKVNIAWTRYSSEKPSLTIDTGHRHHFHYTFNRIPTVRENARLQSFRDNFVFFGTKTSQYRQVGNAVPPLLASKIYTQLVENRLLS